LHNMEDREENEWVLIKMSVRAVGMNVWRTAKKARSEYFYPFKTSDTDTDTSATGWSRSADRRIRMCGDPEVLIFLREVAERERDRSVRGGEELGGGTVVRDDGGENAEPATRGRDDGGGYKLTDSQEEEGGRERNE
jgi:hypothetical protein